MAYSPLPIVEVPLDRVVLDLENYRIPVASEDEFAALNYLYSEQDVYSTALSILRDGYFDNEVPVVYPSGDEYVVLEGNRRVSALKVLADPTLIPAHEAVIRRLLRRYETESLDLPTTIRVMVSPDRGTPRRHIARVHTGLSKKPWSRDQQAKYYYSLLSPATTVDDVRGMYPGVGVPRLIKMAVMREFLSAVQFRDGTLHEYAISDALTMSSFEYAYRMADIAEAVGVKFTKDGLLDPVTRSARAQGAALAGPARGALEILMSRFRSVPLNTRSPEFRSGTEQHERLMAELLGNAYVPPSPDPKPTPAPEPTPDPAGPDDPDGDGPSEGGLDGGGDAPSEPVPGAPRGPNHPDTKDQLVLTGLDYSTFAPVTLQGRYHELRRLSLARTPVAAAMLLRAVLESTIKFHFEGTATPATGELKACMTLVQGEYGSLRPVMSAINKIASSDVKTPGSVNWFNDVTHSADAIPTPDTVRAALELLHPVLRHLLRPPGSGS